MSITNIGAETDTGKASLSESTTPKSNTIGIEGDSAPESGDIAAAMARGKIMITNPQLAEAIVREECRRALSRER